MWNGLSLISWLVLQDLVLEWGAHAMACSGLVCAHNLMCWPGPDGPCPFTRLLLLVRWCCRRAQRTEWAVSSVTAVRKCSRSFKSCLGIQGLFISVLPYYISFGLYFSPLRSE